MILTASTSTRPKYFGTSTGQFVDDSIQNLGSPKANERLLDKRVVMHNIAVHQKRLRRLSEGNAYAPGLNQGRSRGSRRFRSV